MAVDSRTDQDAGVCGWIEDASDWSVGCCSSRQTFESRTERNRPESIRDDYLPQSSWSCSWSVGNHTARSRENSNWDPRWSVDEQCCEDGWSARMESERDPHADRARDILSDEGGFTDHRDKTDQSFTLGSGIALADFRAWCICVRSTSRQMSIQVSLTNDSQLKWWEEKKNWGEHYDSSKFNRVDLAVIFTYLTLARFLRSWHC